MQLRTYRKIHRWLGLIVGIQLLLWTAGGLFFSLNPIAAVRGETESAEPPPLLPEPTVSPDTALAQILDRHPQAEIQTVLLRPFLDGAVYEMTYLEDGEQRWALADASSGQLRDPISKEEAVVIAKQDYSLESPIADVVLVTETQRGAEYRGRPLPAYLVTFDDSLGARLYVSVDRGVVTARRNDRWRLFDLMWMLHIMDYQDRDDFNSPLLQAASVLGLVTVLSGFILAGLTSPRLRQLVERRQSR